MHSATDLAFKISKRIGKSVHRHISELLDDSRASENQQSSNHAPEPQQPNPPFLHHDSPPYCMPQHHDPSSPLQCNSQDTPRKIEIIHVEELGVVRSSTTRVERDLGFQGRLGDHILLTYGDTMYRDEKCSDNFIGMTCNSVAIATPNPISVYDPLLNHDGFPKYLLEPAAEYGENGNHYSLGITNVIELGPGRGMLYFLLNYREHVESDIRGAGVAMIKVDNDCFGQPVPKATRLCKWWWDGETEPWYGDVCSIRFNGFVYALGHARDKPWVYITRVPEQEVFDLDAYEYWNGKCWQPERLCSPALGEEQSIMWQINQGQVFWSEYHRCLLFVYCDAWWTDQVLIRMATQPEGPWSEPQTVYKAKRAKPDGCIYCAVPHPYFDPTGKTLVITYTNMPAIVETIKLTFG